MGELDAWGIIHEAQRQECYLRIRKNRRLDPFFSRLDFPNADFSERERIKLAYELAESALIFLQTKGCSQLCSCAVSCACVDVRTEEHEFYFRVNDICHLEPEFRETRPTKHWCAEELLNMHVLRLEVLSVKIALGYRSPRLRTTTKQRKLS